MHLILWFIFIVVSHFTGVDQAILRSSFNNDRYLNPISTSNLSNEIYFTWILYPPWQRHNDLFNDKPYNNSVEYFNISEDDHITNESYIETSKLTICNEVNLTFYSKVNSPRNNITLILFLYKQNAWNKEWEYTTNDSQWEFHQLKFNITDQNDDIQFRFLPTSNSSYQIWIIIGILSITTHTNCMFNNSQLKHHSYHENKKSIHAFLFISFGSAFLLIFITIMVVFIYGIINKQYNQWIRKRSSQRRKKGRKTRNIIRDESTILGVETDIV